eukprot:Skav201264  [mRNA]  locus=scaffold1129:111136:111351:+ [translate_table: standard]
MPPTVSKDRASRTLRRATLCLDLREPKSEHCPGKKSSEGNGKGSRSPKRCFGALENLLAPKSCSGGLATPC